MQVFSERKEQADDRRVVELPEDVLQPRPLTLPCREAHEDVNGTNHVLDVLLSSERILGTDSFVVCKVSEDIFCDGEVWHVEVGVLAVHDLAELRAAFWIRGDNCSGRDISFVGATVG